MVAAAARPYALARTGDSESFLPRMVRRKIRRATIPGAADAMLAAGMSRYTGATYRAGNNRKSLTAQESGDSPPGSGAALYCGTILPGILAAHSFPPPSRSSPLRPPGTLAGGFLFRKYSLVLCD